jgi:SPP1 family predicted phage head-tail adaptor
MPAGALRHRIIIQQNTPTRSAIGSPVDSWSTLCTVWARIQPADPKGLNYGQQRKWELSHIFTMRERTGIEPGMRVSFDGRLFTINGVVMSEEWALYQDLYCHESVSNAT